MITWKNIIDQVRRSVYGGMPPDSAEITVNLVFLYAKEGLAMALKKYFNSTFAIDMKGDIPDASLMTFSPYTITQDPLTKWYSFPLPAMPLALPENMDISNVFLLKPSGNKIECSRIGANDLSVMFEVPMDTSEVYYWIDSGNVNMWSMNDITKASAYIRMPYADGGNINSNINCPPDLIGDVVSFTLQLLNEQVKMPATTQNENIEAPNINK